MKSKWLIILISLTIIGIGIRLKFGVYSHDEFIWEKHLFIKHRITWKWHFYSPVGMSDLTIDERAAEIKEEEILFDEFVRSRGLSR
jgi:hypothetical protein